MNLKLVVPVPMVLLLCISAAVAAETPAPLAHWKLDIVENDKRDTQRQALGGGELVRLSYFGERWANANRSPDTEAIHPFRGQLRLFGQILRRSWTIRNRRELGRARRFTAANLPQSHGIPKILLDFSSRLTNRVSAAAMISMAGRFNRLSPWKKGRPMIDILLLSTTVFVVIVVLMVFPPPAATSSQ